MKNTYEQLFLNVHSSLLDLENLEKPGILITYLGNFENHQKFSLSLEKTILTLKHNLSLDF